MLSLVRDLGWGTAFGVALAASLLGRVREASACSPPPNGWFPIGTFPTPANGVVLLRYGCDVDCETPPSVESFVLKNEAGELVPGSVVFTEVRDTNLDIAFRPEPGAVTEASFYTAELDGVPVFDGILVGPAVTWNDALTLTEEIFEVDHPTGETRCCTGPIDSCGNTPCFRTQVERRTTVTVGWYEDLSPEHYQYVFRVGSDGIDPATPWSWNGAQVRFELDPTENTACYVLELKRLADDSVQSFGERCIEQPDTFTPGLHTTPDEDISTVLEICDEPPDGYEKAWCDARLPVCESSPDEPWCGDMAERCAMVGAGGAAGASSVDTGGTAGGGTAGTAQGPGGKAGSSGAQGGSGGAPMTGGSSSIPSGAGGTAEGGAPDAEGGDASQGERVFTKGCGCSVPGNGPREPAPLVVAVALVAVALRRRRAKRRALPDARRHWSPHR